MGRLASAVDPRSAEFGANRAAMQTLVADLRRESARIARGGSPAAIERHRARGRLVARERIDLLLDPGAPFLEQIGRAHV
jgi:3-methylcrotonyl-CoA carboxylase beta subunit